MANREQELKTSTLILELTHDCQRKTPTSPESFAAFDLHSKAQAYNSGSTQVAELLNDMELLPEYLADQRDCTSEFVDMLQGIAQMHPGCRYIMEDFEQAN